MHMSNNPDAAYVTSTDKTPAQLTWSLPSTEENDLLLLLQFSIIYTVTCVGLDPTSRPLVT